MERATIQDWTFGKVPIKGGSYREVEYRVCRDGYKHIQEVREKNGAPIHTLRHPDGMQLDRGSYEVLLRYVLVDVVAARSSTDCQTRSRFSPRILRMSASL